VRGDAALRLDVVSCAGGRWDDKRSFFACEYERTQLN
jgi:hypothetical protein